LAAITVQGYEKGFSTISSIGSTFMSLTNKSESTMDIIFEILAMVFAFVSVALACL